MKFTEILRRLRRFRLALHEYPFPAGVGRNHDKMPFHLGYPLVEMKQPMDTLYPWKDSLIAKSRKNFNIKGRGIEWCQYHRIVIGRHLG